MTRRATVTVHIRLETKLIQMRKSEDKNDNSRSSDEIELSTIVQGKIWLFRQINTYSCTYVPHKGLDDYILHYLQIVGSSRIWTVGRRA